MRSLAEIWEWLLATKEVPPPAEHDAQGDAEDVPRVENELPVIVQPICTFHTVPGTSIEYWSCSAVRTMIYTTQIARLDGLVLVASTDDANVSQLNEFKQQIRAIIKKLGPSAEPRASIEGDAYTMHYVLDDSLVFVCITEGSYPKKLAFTYLEDVRKEFQGSYKRDDYLDPSLRPYAYAEFERFLERTKRLYQDGRAQDNMHRLNDELKDVHKAMTKNINDLLYRGDSLDKMGDMSSRLREDSAKYKRAAVRINWELLLKQYGPIAGIATIIVLFLFWRFFW